VTLLEVLFAVMVTIVGLLGCLALLPVASSVAKKGRVNDANAVAATRCLHEFDARGMRRGVQTWIAFDPTFSPPQFRLVSAMSLPYGISYCIDPRFIAANDINDTVRTAARAFPYSASGTEPTMLRITLSDGAPTLDYMKQLQADSIFMIDDDLTYDRPESDRTLMPTQTYVNVPGATSPPQLFGKRQNDGHMSWMATLVPKRDRYTASFNETYVLSIVMFYDRPTSFGYDTATSSFSLPDERTLGVSFPGGGLTGGEVLLTATTEAELNVRSNDWILLTGTMTHATAGAIPVFKWYRVLDTEAEVTPNALGTGFERYVTLMGPDWEAALMSNQRAVIVEGVVAVYEKTIRLE
jgi:hypothetical protein